MKKFAILQKTEIVTVLLLSLVLFLRMFSIFLVLPVFNILAQEINNANFFLVALAFGIYGLTQGLCQLPAGYFSDVWGRKRILIIALILFLIGSLLASYVTNIYWVIAARFIQGMGAMASVIFALLADKTRNEVRARASAFLGMSIGIAFCLAFVLAPILSIWWSIHHFFKLISFLSFISLGVVILFVQDTKTQPKKNIVFGASLQSCLKNKQLKIIYFGSFFSGMGLSSILFTSQIFLFNYLGFPKEELWKIYLFMLGASFLFMFPVTFYAESKNKFDRAILLGVGFLMFSFILIMGGIYQLNFWLIAASLVLFFVGFSIFEPIFPSLVTRLSSEENKGIASGFFQTFQFLGHFVGALASGFLLKHNIFFVFLFLLVYGVFFLLLLRKFKNPVR